MEAFRSDKAMPFYAGCFLIARSKLIDPNFRQSVVLLLAHNDDGAYGVVVNKPLEIAELPFPVFLGGPCESPGLILLHGHKEWQKLTKGDDDDPPNGIVVADGIFVGNGRCLKRATQAKQTDKVRYRVFRNYAGWGPGQLEAELAEKAWSIGKATGKLLFSTPTEELWLKLAPSNIPEPSLN